MEGYGDEPEIARMGEGLPAGVDPFRAEVKELIERARQLGPRFDAEYTRMQEEKDATGSQAFYSDIQALRETVGGSAASGLGQESLQIAGLPMYASPEAEEGSAMM